MPNVMKCMCEECKYNEKHECCADNIEVRSSGDKNVKTSEGTCCNTFESRDFSCKCK